jgi:hypothetical protein
VINSPTRAFPWISVYGTWDTNIANGCEWLALLGGVVGLADPYVQIAFFFVSLDVTDVTATKCHVANTRKASVSTELNYRNLKIGKNQFDMPHEATGPGILSW